MNRISVALIIMLGVASVSAGPISERQLFGATIGQVLPKSYKGQGSNMGLFTFLSVPIAHPQLKAELHAINLFSDSKTGIVAGYRGDRPFHEKSACKKSANRINVILRQVYPIPYIGSDTRYILQSKKGDIVAGARCTNKGPFSRLTLEVTNPIIEESLFGK